MERTCSSSFQLPGLGLLQSQQNRLPATGQHQEQQRNRSQQQQTVLPTPEHQQQRGGSHDQQRIKDHSCQGGAGIDLRTQNTHPFHQVPDAPGEVLEQIAAHEQRHESDALRPMPQPPHHLLPGQSIDRDAGPRQEQAETQPAPTGSIQVDQA